MNEGSSVRALAARLRSRGRTALVRRVGVDARALAAFRVSLGVLLVLDVLLRSRNLVAFYTDSGILPRAILRESYPVLSHASLHALSGSAWVQAALFAVAVGFALALLVGYRTTPATAGSLGLLFSFHARNPFVLTGGDTLLVHLLFWGLFLPLGERWSVDARREDADPTNGRRPRRRRNPRRGAPTGRRVASVASAALLTQVVIVYVVNGALKLRGNLWTRGEAIQYVFRLDQFTVLLGDVLVNYPGLLRLFDRLWLGMILCSVLLVALTGRARALLVALFVGMHLGMVLTLRLGIFPLVSVAALLPFLPPIVWDRVESAAPTGVSVPGFLALASVSAIPFLHPISTFSPSISSVPSVPATLSGWAGRLCTPVVACLLAAMLLWNTAVLGYLDSNGAVTADDTPWNMFAPDPMRTVGWYVVPGELASGGRIDAFHREPVRWDRPPDVAQAYPNDRWRKYLKHLRWSGSPDQRRAFAGYLCDRWNRRHDDELVRLSVHFVSQPTRLDGTGPTRRIELGNYSCSVVGTST